MSAASVKSGQALAASYKPVQMLLLLRLLMMEVSIQPRSRKYFYSVLQTEHSTAWATCLGQYGLQQRMTQRVAGQYPQTVQYSTPYCRRRTVQQQLACVQALVFPCIYLQLPELMTCCLMLRCGTTTGHVPSSDHKRPR